jgi:exodeoxyribonuclease-1
VVRKRFGEPGILLAPHERHLESIGPERRSQMEQNIAWLKAHPSEFGALIRHHRHYRYPFIPDLDPDAGLYQNGFLPRPDEALCREFHAASTPGKIEIIDRFKSREARVLAARLLFRNFADGLPDALLRESEAHRQRIRSGLPIADINGRPRITPQRALAEIRDLRQAGGLDREQQELLDELEREIADRWACPPEPQTSAPPSPA